MDDGSQYKFSRHRKIYIGKSDIFTMRDISAIYKRSSTYCAKNSLHYISAKMSILYISQNKILKKKIKDQFISLVRHKDGGTNINASEDL